VGTLARLGEVGMRSRGMRRKRDCPRALAKPIALLKYKMIPITPFVQICYRIKNGA